MNGASVLESFQINDTILENTRKVYLTSIKPSRWKQKIKPSMDSLTNPADIKNLDTISSAPVVTGKEVIVDGEDYKLHPSVFQQLCFIHGTPGVDLFSSQDNRQVRRFCSFSEADKSHADLYHFDAFNMLWNKDTLYYANPPFSRIKEVLQHAIKSETKRLLLITPARKYKDLLWEYVIDDPIILDTVESKNLFLPPNKTVDNIGVGETPWKDTAAWLISGNARSQRMFKGLFTPKFIKLSDLLEGRTKASPTLNTDASVPDATAFLASARTFSTHIENGPETDNFKTLSAALEARWKDVKAYAGESAFREYDVKTNIHISTPPTLLHTPMFSYITVCGFNVIAVIDSGSGITIASNHPSLEALFPINFRANLRDVSISGIGHVQAKSYIRQRIALRGLQGQYINVCPTFLIVPMKEPVIIIGNDTITAMKLFLLPCASPPFCLSAHFPDYIIPCSVKGEVPKEHLHYDAKIIDGFARLVDCNDSPKIMQEAFLIHPIIREVESITALDFNRIYQMEINRKIVRSEIKDISEPVLSDVLNRVSLPKPAACVQVLTQEQIRFLCQCFKLDVYVTTSFEKEFEEILHEQLHIDLS